MPCTLKVQSTQTSWSVCLNCLRLCTSNSTVKTLPTHTMKKTVQALRNNSTESKEVPESKYHTTIAPVFWLQTLKNDPSNAMNIMKRRLQVCYCKSVIDHALHHLLSTFVVSERSSCPYKQSTCAAHAHPHSGHCCEVIFTYCEPATVPVDSCGRLHHQLWRP